MQKRNCLICYINFVIEIYIFPTIRKLGWVQWHMPIISTIQETEAEGLQETERDIWRDSEETETGINRNIEHQ